MDRRSLLAAAAAAAAAAPLAANANISDGTAGAGVAGVNIGVDGNSSSRFNNKGLGNDDRSINDGTEDAVAAIARRNAEKLKAEQEAKQRRYQKTDEDIEREQQQKKNLILGIAGGGTLLSGAFIIPNLTRLATKIASGGADDGRAKTGAKKGAKKGKPAPKIPSAGEKLFSAAFGRKL